MRTHLSYSCLFFQLISPAAVHGELFAVLDGEYEGDGVLFYDAFYGYNSTNVSYPNGIFNNGIYFPASFDGATDGDQEAPAIASGIARRGGKSIRFRLKDGAHSSKDRTELYFAIDSIAGHIPFDEEQKLGFSLQLDGGSATDGTFIFIQFHQYAPGRPPISLELEYIDTHWCWKANVHNDDTGLISPSNADDKGTGDDPSDNYSIEPAITSGKEVLQADRWYDFILQYRLGTNGYLKVSCSPSDTPSMGSPVIDWSGPIGYLDSYTNVSGGTWARGKCGMYRPDGVGGEQTIYIDELRHGTGWAEADVRYVAPIKWRLETIHGFWMKPNSADSYDFVFQSDKADTSDYTEWKLTHIADGYYTIVNVAQDTAIRCATDTNYEDIEVGVPNATNDQYLWKLGDMTNGGFRLINKYTENYIRQAGSSSSPGNDASHIEQRTDELTGVYTQWKLLPIFD